MNYSRGVSGHEWTVEKKEFHWFIVGAGCMLSIVALLCGIARCIVGKY